MGSPSGPPAASASAGTRAPASIAAPAAPRSDADWHGVTEQQGARYRANPADAEAAPAYAQALGALGEWTQAVAVLRQASMRNPNNRALTGGYGRAARRRRRLRAGARGVTRAHSPDQPDWRILSAQDAVLHQLGRHQDAQRYYASALGLVEVDDEEDVASDPAVMTSPCPR